MRDTDVATWGLDQDRRWMVVRPDGGFLTQRELPAMARIAATAEDGAVNLATTDVPDLRVPIPTPAAERRQVTVWKDRVPALDAGPEAAAWLSATLGLACGLVYLDDPGARCSATASRFCWPTWPRSMRSTRRSRSRSG
jgi:uncharacterized protein YcbX